MERSKLQQTFAFLTVIALALTVATLPFSIKLCHVCILIALVVWLLQGQWRARWNIVKSDRVVLGFCVFFFLHVVGMIYTEDRASGWFDIEKKVGLLVFPIMLATTPKLKSKYLDAIFITFIAACFIGTIICINHAVHLIVSRSIPDPLSSSMFWLINPHASKNWLAFSYVDLASGVEMHPTYLSAYLIFCLLLIYKIFYPNFFFRGRGVQLSLFLLSLYFAIFVVFLSSRITTVTLLGFVFVACYLFDRGEHRLKRFAYSLVVCSFFIGLIFLNPVSRYRNYQEVLHISSPRDNAKPRSLSADIRSSLWWVGVKSIAENNFLTGVGTGDVEQVMKNTGKKYSVYNILGSNDPHNQFIYTMLALGLVGLLSLLYCLTWPVYRAYRRKDFLYLCFVSIFVLVCMTETALELQKGIVFFSIFNSLLIFQREDYPIQL